MSIPWVLCALLLLILIGLIIKIKMLQKSMKEIGTECRDILKEDTNHLISISSRDRYARQLANGLNQELKVLRNQRQKYQNGDLELKEAITNISHDLRTPLTAICGYLDLLESEEQTDTVHNYLNQIRNRSDNLKQLIQELFRYSMIVSVQEETKEKVNINQALEDSLLSFYGAFVKKGITPDIAICETTVYRMVNLSSLTRVFNNVLGNVLKYSDGDLSVSLSPSGEICFSNTAKELDSVTVGRLFDRFFTVESGRSSTGLGLSITRALMERMGGSATAEYRHEKLYITLKFESCEFRGGCRTKCD